MLIMAVVILFTIGLALTLALHIGSPAEVSRRESERLADVPEPSQLRRVPSAHILLAIAVRLLPPSERARYLEEFRAELLDIPHNTWPRHALSLLRGVFVLRLRRWLKNKAANAAVRRAKD
jgi:hypothetical protein